MKRFVSLLMVVMILFAMAAPAMAETYKDAYNHIVRVYFEEYVTVYEIDLEAMANQQAVVRTGNLYQPRALNAAWKGTGFAVGNTGEPVQYFVTNRHVVSAENESGLYYFNYTDSTGTYSIPAWFEYEYQAYIIYTSHNEKVTANVHAISDRCDLAVISLNEPTNKRSAAYIRPMTADELMGVRAYAAGFPGIADLNDVTLVGDALNSYKSDLTITDGMISVVKAQGTTGEGELIQHSAKISGGNSGGPLLDENGYVLGVNTYTMNADGDYALSISANELVRFLDEERVPYAVAPASGSDSLLYILIAAGVLAVVAVVLIVVLTGKKKNTTPNPKPTNGAAATATRSLNGITGALAGQTFPINGRVAIGSDPSRSQIVFPSGTPGISGLHCSITFDGQTVTVTDENSRYGTWLDQTRLTPGTPTVMHRGQTLYFGSQKQSLKLGA